jgi:PilZ domain
MKKKYVKPTITTEALDSSTCNETRTAMREAQPAGNAEAGSRFAERRSVPRYPYVTSALIIEPLAQTRLPAQISEISAKGCYIDKLDELPKNTVIQILIHRDSGAFESWARVAYVNPGSGTGIAFFDTLPAQQQTIDRWIAEISALLERSGLPRS